MVLIPEDVILAVRSIPHPEEEIETDNEKNFAITKNDFIMKRQVVEHILDKYLSGKDITPDTLKKLYDKEMFKVDEDGRLLIAPYITYPIEKDLGTLKFSTDLLCSENSAPGNYVFFFRDEKACACRFIGTSCWEGEYANESGELVFQVNSKYYTIAEYISDCFGHTNYAFIKEGINIESEYLDEFKYGSHLLNYIQSADDKDSKRNIPNYFENLSPELTFDLLNAEAYSVLYDFIKEDYIEEAKKDLEIDEEIPVNHKKIIMTNFKPFNKIIEEKDKEYGVDSQTPCDDEYKDIINSYYEQSYSDNRVAMDKVYNDFYDKTEYEKYLYDELIDSFSVRSNITSSDAPIMILKMRENIYGNTHFGIGNPGTVINENGRRIYKLRPIMLYEAYLKNDYSKVKEVLGITDKTVEKNEQENELDEEEYEHDGLEL